MINRLGRFLRNSAGRIAIVVVTVGGFYWLSDGLEDSLYAHLDAVIAGDLSGAYEQTAPQFRQDMSFEQYEAFIQRYPSLVSMNGYEIGSWETDSSAATVQVTAMNAAGAVLPLVFMLVEEDDVWRIVRVTLADPAGTDNQ